MSGPIIVSSGNKLSYVMNAVLLLILVGAGIFGYLAYKSIMDENKKLKDDIVVFKNITENIARSSTQWTTKSDLTNSLKNMLKKEDLDALKDDLDNIGARLTAVGRTVGSIRSRVVKLEKSDTQGETTEPKKTCEKTGEPIDIHNYTTKIQSKTIKDTNSAPIADVSFDASNSKPWGYEVFGKQYKLFTVVGKKDSGQLTFHHELRYSVPKYGDKEYNINIVSSEYKQSSSKNKWFWLNPVLDANFVFGGKVFTAINGWGRDSILSMGADIGLSISSYGETKIDSWFRLFRFGLGYDVERQAGRASFSPISLNIGKPMPLLNNLYIAPSVGFDTGGGITIGFGLGPQF